MKNKEIKNIESNQKIKNIEEINEKENNIMTDKTSTIMTIIKYFFIVIYTLTIFIFVLHWKYFKWLIKRLKKGFFAIQLPIIINFLTQKNKEAKLND